MQQTECRLLQAETCTSEQDVLQLVIDSPYGNPLPERQFVRDAHRRALHALFLSFVTRAVYRRRKAFQRGSCPQVPCPRRTFRRRTPQTGSMKPREGKGGTCAYRRLSRRGSGSGSQNRRRVQNGHHLCLGQRQTTVIMALFSLLCYFHGMFSIIASKKLAEIGETIQNLIHDC